MLLAVAKYHEAALLSGRKIHALNSDDLGRWLAGKSIQFYCAKPTARRLLLVDICTGYQRATMQTDDVNIFIEIDNRKLTGAELVKFYRAEGFNSWDEFLGIYLPICRNRKTGRNQQIDLKLIHWTTVRY